MDKDLAPLLSICIPTFNRVAALEHLLGCLLGEMKGKEGKVEICISDNGSTDGTQEIISKWKAKLPIGARKNQKNLGYDINAIRALQMARGRYAWYVGDDDLVEPGSVSRLLSDIEKAQGAGAIYINALSIGRPITKFRFRRFATFSKSNSDYPPLNASFGGSICLNTAVANSIIRKKIRIAGRKLVKDSQDRYVFNDFVHTYLFLECILKSGRFGIEPLPAVRIVADANTVSYEKKFYLDLILMTYSLEAKMRYGWFREGAKNYNLKAFLIRAALSLLRPELDEAYLMSLVLHRKLLERDGDHLGLAFIYVLEAARRTPIARQLLVVSFLMMRNIRDIHIKEERDDSRYLKNAIRFAILRANGILG